MLSSWIVSTYKTLVEIALWVFMVIGGIIGGGIGAMMNHGFIGFILGVIAAFFGMAVSLGAAMVLGEILQTVQKIESKLENKA
jgi:amino acid permease